METVWDNAPHFGFPHVHEFQFENKKHRSKKK